MISWVIDDGFQACGLEVCDDEVAGFDEAGISDASALHVVGSERIDERFIGFNVDVFSLCWCLWELRV